jgi:hypothetical protein
MAAKLTRLTDKTAIQLYLVARELYHLQFSRQAASPETFGYTLVICYEMRYFSSNPVPNELKILTTHAISTVISSKLVHNLTKSVQSMKHEF